MNFLFTSMRMKLCHYGLLCVGYVCLCVCVVCVCVVCVCGVCVCVCVWCVCVCLCVCVCVCLDCMCCLAVCTMKLIQYTVFGTCKWGRCYTGSCERSCVSMHWEFMIDLKEDVLVAMGVR